MTLFEIILLSEVGLLLISHLGGDIWAFIKTKRFNAKDEESKKFWTDWHQTQLDILTAIVSLEDKGRCALVKKDATIPDGNL